jgi:hypothetical protein
MYSYTLSLTSALDVVGGEVHAPAALPPGKTLYPLYRRLGRSQGPWKGAKNLAPRRDSIPGPTSPQLYRLRYSGPQ